MKRFLSIIACLALCFALCVPALADEYDYDTAISTGISGLKERYSSIDDSYAYLAYKQRNSSSLVLLYAFKPRTDVKVVAFVSNRSETAPCYLELCPASYPVYYVTLSLSSSNVTFFNFGESTSGRFPEQMSPAQLASRFLYSTVDVYLGEDGEIFFRPAPPVTLAEQLQTQAGELTQTQIAETMDFLVPLGIGLMALLISSVLLRKVFRVFL